MRLALVLSVAVGLLPQLVVFGQTPAPWDEAQATGEPNTSVAGDRETAWASATPDDQDEWLELEYAEAIDPEYVFVYETFNPGALARVCGFTPSGMEAELWSGEDPTERTAGIGVSEIKVETRLKTKRVRIYLNSKDVPGWNEIDAVGLKDGEGKMHWAVRATASSSYARREAVAVGFEADPVFPGFIPVIEFEPATPDPRDERIARLEEEVRELRRLVEDLVEMRKPAPPKK